MIPRRLSRRNASWKGYHFGSSTSSGRWPRGRATRRRAWRAIAALARVKAGRPWGLAAPRSPGGSGRPRPRRRLRSVSARLDPSSVVELRRASGAARRSRLRTGRPGRPGRLGPRRGSARLARRLHAEGDPFQLAGLDPLDQGVGDPGGPDELAGAVVVDLGVGGGVVADGELADVAVLEVGLAVVVVVGVEAAQAGAGDEAALATDHAARPGRPWPGPSGRRGSPCGG